MKKLLLILAINSALPMTANATAYVEQGEFGGIPHGGYSDVTINANTAIVSFHGSTSDSPSKIKEYLLYRCAEVAMNYGYDYFVITSTSLSSKNINIRSKTTYKQMNPPTSTPNKTYAVQKIGSYSESQTSIRPDKCDQSNLSICKTRAAVAVIKMYNGEIPAGMPRAYLVTDVIAHIGPAI